MTSALLSRFTRLDDASPRDQFRIVHIPGLFYHAHNVRAGCGHMRLFGKPLRGWCFYSYKRQVPNNSEWAYHRIWNFGLFAIHHVEPDKKATDPAGWSITWASLRLVKEYRGITLRWQLADTFHAGRERR